MTRVSLRAISWKSTNLPGPKTQNVSFERKFFKKDSISLIPKAKFNSFVCKVSQQGFNFYWFWKLNFIILWYTLGKLHQKLQPINKNQTWNNIYWDWQVSGTFTQCAPGFCSMKELRVNSCTLPAWNGSPSAGYSVQ